MIAEADVPIVALPEDVTAEWLTAALRRGGVIGQTTVTDFTSKSVGAGMLGDSVRFALTYDRPVEGAPASVVGKFASADPVSKATGAGVGLYMKEVGFYRDIRDTVAIRTPTPYFAEINPETQDFTLLLEDMGPARQGDQLAGCGIEDAEAAMVQAAALHGPRWGDPSFAANAEMNRAPELSNYLVDGFPGFLAAFRERYDDMLEPEYMALCCRFADSIGKFFDGPPTPLTLHHLDFRLDNMLFEPQGGRWPLAVLDWQSVAVGPGVLDVGYFIGAGLTLENRRKHEEDLLRLWLEHMRGYGVTDYSWDDAWAHYRHYMLQGVFTAIFASVGTKRTPRGDEMFMTMARRHCAQAIDLDALRLLESR